MSRFLLQLNFLPTGCTDTRIANVGEVNFETESATKCGAVYKAKELEKKIKDLLTFLHTLVQD